MSKKKENTTVKIKCDNVGTATAFMSLLTGHKTNYQNDMNSVFANRGLGVVDTTFVDLDIEKLTMSITINPTDKGSVITLKDETEELGFISYTELQDGQVYAIMDGTIKVNQYIADGIDRTLHVAGTADTLIQMLIEFPKQLKEDELKRTAERKAREDVQEAIEVADCNL